MIELFKFHWFALRNPQKLVAELLPQWPVNIGVGLYIFYVCGTFFQNGKSQKLLTEILAVVFGISATSFVYSYILFTIFYMVMIQYYVQPIIVRKVGNIEKESFNLELYRKIIFYSPVSGVIFNVLVLLPLHVLSAYLLLDGQMTPLSMVIIGVQGIVGMWAAILPINIFAIQWKGLKTHFQLTGVQIVLSMVIIPFIFALPMIFILGKGYMSVLHGIMQ